MTMQEEFGMEGNDGVDLYCDMLNSSGSCLGEGLDLGSPNGDSPPGCSIRMNRSPGVGMVSYNNSTGPPYHDVIAPLRKYQVYVGNLTWWTTDKDIQHALIEVGVTDFIEVKFYENRANGQSKGYCVLTVASDTSLKLIHDQLQKNEINGQIPHVTPPTKQALTHFESMAKTRPVAGTNGGGNMDMNLMGGQRGPMPMPQQMGMGMAFRPGPHMMMGSGGPRGPRGMSPPGPHGQGHPGNRGRMGTHMHNPTFRGMPNQMMPHNLPPQPGGGPPRMQLMHDPFYQGGPPLMGPRPMQPMMDPRGPPFPGPHRHDYRGSMTMNSYPPNGHPSPAQGPGPGPNLRGPLPLQQMQGSPRGPPTPHMNPAFFEPAGPPGSPYNTIGSPGGLSYVPSSKLVVLQAAITDAEFDDIMSRNRTVSSSAISRAVSDAATGEFASAIETLVTAISLIKQSKVAHDDRCKILVSSLQDTLHGIEAKSYGSPSSRDGISERARSRDRDRHRRSRRERTRSRDREYRERYNEYPRERERSRSHDYRERQREVRDEGPRVYYEDRDRYRDRERAGESARSSRSDVERPREREPERDRGEREVVSNRAPRH